MQIKKIHDAGRRSLIYALDKQTREQAYYYERLLIALIGFKRLQQVYNVPYELDELNGLTDEEQCDVAIYAIYIIKQKLLLDIEVNEVERNEELP